MPALPFFPEWAWSYETTLFIQLPLLFFFANLDIICKSPVALHDDTSRHGQERCERWVWQELLSGEINAWKMMDTSLYYVFYWAVTAGIFYFLFFLMA